MFADEDEPPTKKRIPLAECPGCDGHGGFTVLVGRGWRRRRCMICRGYGTMSPVMAARWSLLLSD